MRCVLWSIARYSVFTFILFIIFSMPFIFFFVVYFSFLSVLCLVFCALCIPIYVLETDFTVLKFRDNNIIIYYYLHDERFFLYAFPLFDAYSVHRPVTSTKATVYGIHLLVLQHYYNIIITWSTLSSSRCRSPFLSEDFSRLCHECYYSTKRY